MKIKVGTSNPIKVQAVEETVSGYPVLFPSPRVVGVEVDSGIGPQPLSEAETVLGATNRSRAALENDLGTEPVLCIGIESGLKSAPSSVISYKQTEAAGYGGRYMNFTVVVMRLYCEHAKVYETIGYSTAFQVPPHMMSLIMKGDENYEVDDAVFDMGLSTDRHIGERAGLLGKLTGNRITRKDYTKQALHMAIIGLQHMELYRL